MSMRTRLAEKKDVPQLVLLLNELFSIETDFTADPVKQNQGLMLLLDNSERGFIFVVEEEEHQILGMCSVQYLISTAEGGKVGLLEDMIIKDGYRRKGIGRYLISEILSYAKNEGCKRIQLLADQENLKALEFYKNVGFSRTQLIALRKQIPLSENLFLL